MKIAIFLPNWIGDAVMATPALRAVRVEYPSAEIVAVTRPYVADVLAGNDLVDRTIFHNPRGSDPSQRGWSFIKQLQAEHFDVALLLPNSLRSGWNAWMSGAKRRVGFARNGRSWMLTDAVKPQPKNQPHPALDEYLRLAQQLGCRQLAHKMELATLPADEHRLQQFWGTQSPELQQQDVISLNPGGAFGAAKHWPTESFGRLAARIASELHKTVLILCGPAERDEARSIVRHADHPLVTSLADVEPSIGLTKAAVKHSQLLVTTDSGPRHFAPPFNVPVVTLFGPTHIEWSETHYARAVHLQLPVDCGPCQQRVCPLKHHKCMRDLSVDQVYAAVHRVLIEHKENAA